MCAFLIVKVQALGNWGEGEINPSRAASAVGLAEGVSEEVVGSEAAEGLDDFFSSMLEPTPDT